MKRTIFYLVVSASLLIMYSCKKESQCIHATHIYQYREISTHNMCCDQAIDVCDKERKDAFYRNCPSGYEVIWN